MGTGSFRINQCGNPDTRYPDEIAAGKNQITLTKQTMIKKIFFAGSLLMLVTSVNSLAQSKDETAVAAAVDALKKAMLDADKTNLDKLTASELSYGHSSGKVETKAEFVDALVTGKSDFVSINLADQTIKIVGNTAIVRHTLNGETNDNGNKGTVKLFILTVWQKDKGQWKLLARQAARPPQQ
jgi:hypothetical protein